MKSKVIDTILIGGFLLAIATLALLYFAVDGPAADIQSVEIHEIPTPAGPPGRI